MSMKVLAVIGIIVCILLLFYSWKIERVKELKQDSACIAVYSFDSYSTDPVVNEAIRCLMNEPYIFWTGRTLTPEQIDEIRKFHYEKDLHIWKKKQSDGVLSTTIFKPCLIPEARWANSDEFTSNAEGIGMVSDLKVLAETDYLYITDADLTKNFPLKTGTFIPHLSLRQKEELIHCWAREEIKEHQNN